MDLMYCMYSVCNSANFAKFIVSQTLDDNKSCVSFDVVSLFHIVPTDHAIQVACQHLQNEPSLAECTSLTKTGISNLLEFCLKTTYSLYQEVHRTAACSPIFAVVADVLMEDVESQPLSSFSSTCCALQTDLIQDVHHTPSKLH